MKSIYSCTAAMFVVLVGAALFRPHLMKAGPGSATTVKPNVSAAASAGQKMQIAENYGKLPLSFEVIQGQTDSRVKFLSRGRGYSLFLTGDEAVLTLKKSSVVSRQSSVAGNGHRSVVSGRMPDTAKAGHRTTDNGQLTTDSVLRMKLVGANAHAAVTGTDELPGKSNYFIGNDPKQWRTNVPTYAQVKYAGVYPGVDLVYYGNQGGQLEYDFAVAPGANPSAIVLDVGAGLVPAQGHPRGVPLRIADDGDLVAKTDGGEVRFQKPVVYQTKTILNRQSSIDNRQFLEGRYTLDAENHVRFEVAPYDHSKPLVIDPVLTYGTYLGGSTSGDRGNAIAVDSSGSVYVTGYANSANFPTVNPYDGTKKTPSSVTGFVSKINAAGTALVYSTYLGGSYYDEPEGIAIDSLGDAFVTGETGSSDFPLAHAYQPYPSGFSTAFVTELNPTGSALVYSTYLGGGNEGTSIAVDSNGDAYVTGGTPYGFIPTANAYQATYSGFEAVFVTKLHFNGSVLSLPYSTYLGGGNSDFGFGIAVDSSGNAYITGRTSNSAFPLKNPIQPTCGSCAAGTINAFVAEFNSTGSDLVYSTYLGGSGPDAGQAIAVDSAGNAYVTGYTYSSNFPTQNPVQSTCASCSASASDDFAAKLSTSGTALVYSTYLGGNWYDQAYAIAVDPSGDAYVAGYSGSTDFPTWNWLQQGTGFCGIATVTELNPTGSFVYSTYLGPACNAGNWGLGIAVDYSSNAYLTGFTDPGFPTVNPLQGTDYSSGETGFVAKLSPGTPVVNLEPPSLTFAAEAAGVTSTAQDVTLTNTGTATLLFPYRIYASGPFSETDDCGASVAPGGSCTLSVTFTPYLYESTTGSLTITDNASATNPQTVPLNGSLAGVSATLSPSSLPFGTWAQGSTSGAAAVTLTSTGVQPLTLTGVSFTGPNAGDFSEATSNCPYGLAPGASCSIQITFTPSALGAESATLIVSDNAASSPQTVALSGTGTAPVLLFPSSANFGIVALGSFSAPETITLANTQSVPLNNINITLNNPDFTWTTTCGATLAPHALCTITVVYSPGNIIEEFGTLMVTDSAGNSPQTATFQGRGKPRGGPPPA